MTLVIIPTVLVLKVNLTNVHIPPRKAYDSGETNDWVAILNNKSHSSRNRRIFATECTY